MIEFAIGPKSKTQHNEIIKWLSLNSYVVKNISNAGYHYSEIDVYGDFNKFSEKWKDTKGLSYENWE